MSKHDIVSQEHWDDVFHEFQNESPRAAVIVAAAFMDELLQEMLAGYFVDDKRLVGDILGPSRALGAFGARIRVAYALGLISPNEYADLLVFSKIRNLFAHSAHSLGLDDSEVSKLCAKLRTADGIIAATKQRPHPYASDLMTNIAMLVSQLGLRAVRAKQQRRTKAVNFVAS